MDRQPSDTPVTDESTLNFHLMHPGGDSSPGDPNAAFCIDGTYHLHYILSHMWQGNRSYSFVHVTSTDMLNWTWQKTKLQPSLTGHGMFSGTGFITKEGLPAAIYHGQKSGSNQIAIAKDKTLTAWEKPYPVQYDKSDDQRQWDPDCFIVGDTYYAFGGGGNQPLVKSLDLTNWTYVGDFMRHETPDTAIGEDISCPNFFPLGNKWMLLCISHSFGCRYYLGDWDNEAEQFVPESHGRMNWRRPEESLFKTVYRDFFAPESVLTTDGRRVMWAWLATINEEIYNRTIMSLPRELSLGDDGSLRIRPLRELEALRHDKKNLSEIAVATPQPSHNASMKKHLMDLNGDSFEIRVRVSREQATRKRFGLMLFANDDLEGFPIMIRPETGTIRVGTTDAPFAVCDLPEAEDVEIRIYIDKYLVEVFVNDRQSVVGAHDDYCDAQGFYAYTYGTTTILKEVEVWRIQPTNEGFLKARENCIWAPDTE